MSIIDGYIRILHNRQKRSTDGLPPIFLINLDLEQQRLIDLCNRYNALLEAEKKGPYGLLLYREMKYANEKVLTA